MARRALIVFARPPVPGAVKTRLMPLLTAEESAALYQAFLEDALAQYRSLNAAVRLYMAEDGDPGVPLDGATLHAQTGRGLGPRMANAFAETRDAGFSPIVIVGSDHPTLPTAYLETAFAVLHPEPAISIGPTADGGYYALGMAPVEPDLFEGIVYSQPGVYPATVARARATRARVVELEPWYDVDQPADLIRLWSSRASLPPATAHAMHALARRYPAQFTAD